MEKAGEGGSPILPKTEGGSTSAPNDEGGSPSSPEKGGVWALWVAIIGLLAIVIFVFGFIGVIIWFYIQHSYPDCYVEKFDVFALKQATNSFQYNNTIHFEVKLIGGRSRSGVYYDTLNFTFYYKHNLTSYPIGNARIDPFYQHPRGLSPHRDGFFEAKGITWGNVTTPLIFKVELAMATRYRTVLWKTKRHHVVVEADILVNDKGNLAKEKKLGSEDMFGL